MKSDPHAGSRFHYGIPLVEPPKHASVHEHRSAVRFFCRGQVRLSGREHSPLQAELLDISANGFRVALAYPSHVVGAEVEFSHEFFQGRARLMWILEKDSRFEAGWMVLRD